MSLSLYIPRVSADISQQFIAHIFERDYGKVNHVDLINKIDNNCVTYYSAYIHFDYWYDNQMVRSLKNIIDHDDVNNKTSGLVYYNDYSYWKVLKNRSKKIVSGERREKVDLNTHIIKKEDEFPAPPLDPMLTNADFAKMCWAPKKNELDYILEDKEFKDICKTLFTQPEPCDIQNFDYVSADYAKALEFEISLLRDQLDAAREKLQKLEKYSDDVEICQNKLLLKYNNNLIQSTTSLDL